MRRRCSCKGNEYARLMADPVFLSWVAIAVSVASATAGVVSARAAREATRLQQDEHKRRAVRLSASIDEAASDDVHTALRITNSGHKTVWIMNVQLRDSPMLWDRSAFSEVSADGGSTVFNVAKSDFKVKAGQEVIIEWLNRPLTGEKRKTVKYVL